MKTRPRAIRPLVLATCIVASLSAFAWRARAAAPTSRYTIDSASGTVLDNKTGLMWQRSVPTTWYTWIGALAYCEDLSLAGHSDWRLPSMKELYTIVDVKAFAPAIATAAFPDTPSECFWSSTPDAGAAWVQYALDFESGGDCGLRGNTLPIRCVR